jgi:hypothetical protein
MIKISLIGGDSLVLEEYRKVLVMTVSRDEAEAALLRNFKEEYRWFEVHIYSVWKRQ